jgi:hypothetical protein
MRNSRTENPKVQYRLHKSSILISGLSEIHSVHTLMHCSFRIHFDILLVCFRGRMRWTDRLARTGEKRKAYRYWWESHKEGDYKETHT